eukprot:COSAG02_NODE_46920_length_345_cov_0.626016_1_plen_23_part_01
MTALKQKVALAVELAPVIEPMNM